MTDRENGTGSPNRSEQRLLGVVLAGGRSSRMGRDKALLPHPSGGTFLEYVAALVGSRCRHLIISGQQTLPGVPTLPDPVQDQGPAMGVMAAVQEAGRLQLAAALVVAVDMPGVVPDDLQRLIEAWDRQPRHVVAASFADGFPEPLLAIYPLFLLDALRELAVSRHRSLSRWLSQQACCHVPLPSRAAANLNTMEQWKRFQTALPHDLAMTQRPTLAYESPQAAIKALADHLLTVETEEVPLAHSSGRILRRCVTADRDSPAADVSAMDGYAVCTSDLSKEGPLSVSGESVPGHAPPRRESGQVVRIFTGGIVPDGFDLVVRREDTEEEADAVQLTDAARHAQLGQNIRRRGENAAGGDEILPVGRRLHAGAIAAAANFGAARVTVSRPVRVALIVTGDELRSVEDGVEPWQLRDSNGITLASVLQQAPWMEVVSQTAVDDRLPGIRQAIETALEKADAVVMTGGVSMGDYDHVPTAVKQAGGEIVFHKLPVRPGKPILGAVDPQGRPIVGLPGNPVSAAVGGRRFLLTWLAKMAGSEPVGQPAVMLVDRPGKTLPLYWMRLVQLQPDGRVRLVPSRGSGDLVSLAASTGFIEHPPHADTLGPWPYWAWS